MKEIIPAVRQSIHNFLKKHSLAPYKRSLYGDFCLRRGFRTPDLYGMIDAVYVLYTLGELAEWTSRESRERWAESIIACQSEYGWFEKSNKRGHSKEHATAYAIGALRLLEMEEDEQYVTRLKPIQDLLPILTDSSYLRHWLERLDFCWNPKSILKKNLGWYHIWRGSHVGGGVAATIGMLGEVIGKVWKWNIDIGIWFELYFDWLNKHINPDTGYWQRAFWNRIWKKPTIIDLGGAAHFYWIYEVRKQPFPYPEAAINSTLSLQRPSGLYKDKPFCLDLDGNFIVVRSYRQLDKDKQERWRDKVFAAVNKSGQTILKILSEQNLGNIYADLHGLPGAMAGLMECTKLDGTDWGETLSGWKHPLDKVMWL
jgi:hypothetical protein